MRMTIELVNQDYQCCLDYVNGDYPEYLAFADTVENWRTEIFNYFDNRYTNAITESLNRVSKEISAQGKGYNFKVLRAKIL